MHHRTGRKVQNTPVTASAGRAFLAFAALFVVTFVAAIVAQGRPPSGTGSTPPNRRKRGAGLYQAHCAACHGDTLLGGEAAPALVGDTFNSTWEGVTLGDLFDRIRSTMPQNQPGSLSRSQNSDVLAFILASGKFPAGDKAFDAQAHG